MSGPPIAENRYLSLTTYRTSGEGVPTPVWVVGLDDGRLGFWTSMGTGKTTRLARDPRVSVVVCDARGNVADEATPRSGTAAMVRSGRDFEEVRGRIRAKYGVLIPVTRLLRRLGLMGRRDLGYADTVVLVTLDD